MRYAPAGLCLNDFALFGDGPYHLMHLQGPWTPDFDAARMETSYGLAVSDDLVWWKPSSTCFGVGRPGAFDESAVWTMHPFPHGPSWAMLYTGVTALDYPRQRVGLAYSDRSDGTGWRRAGTEPVSSPDPRWYVTGPGEGWRDPWIVDGQDFGARHAMLVAAQAVGAPAGQAGCVGIATSDDLSRWQTQPPLLFPGNVDELECPIIEPADGALWLLGSVNPGRQIYAWRAEGLAGPWQPAGALGPPGPYAPRLVTGPDGRRLLVHTVPRRVGLTDDGAWCRGMLAQPKVFSIVAGQPALSWWDGLEAHLGPSVDPGDAGRDAVFDLIPADLPIRLALRAPALTMSVSDTMIEVVTAAGSVLQQARLATPPGHLRVLTYGEYVEVYADGVFTLATTSYASGSGPAAVVDGRGQLTARAVITPDDGRDDASTVWSGRQG